MDKQVIQSMGLMGTMQRINNSTAKLNVLLGKKVYIKDISIDMDLPTYHLPDGKVHIGFNPPKPYEMGYGVRDE